MKYASGKFSKLTVELTTNPGTDREKKQLISEGDKMFNLKVAANNYGSAAEELIDECTVAGFTMKPIDVKSFDRRSIDGRYTTYTSNQIDQSKDLLQSQVAVRDIVVNLPSVDGGEDVSKRIAVNSIIEAIVADEIVDTPEELIDAVENAEDGEIIEIMSDMTLEEPLAINNGITLDMGGNTLTGGVVISSNEAVLTDGTVVTTAGPAVTLENDGEVVLTGDVTLEGAEDAIRLNGCMATISGGTFKATKGYAVHSVSGTNTINISGGTFIGEAGALKADVATTWNITGGTFSSDPSEYVDLEVYRVIENPDGTYTIKQNIPYTCDWYSTFAPTDTKITRTTTGRVVIYKDGVALNTKAAYAEQLENWELVYDPEYLTVSTAPTATAYYVNFVLKGLKAGETTIEYRNKVDDTVKVSQTIKIDHYLALYVAPSGTHLVESGPVQIADNTTFDGEAMDFDKFTFSTPDTTVATVEGRTITPIAGGKITLVATSNEDPTVSATGTVTFVAAAAKIGDTFYDTITNALKAVTSGDTVVLQRDVTESVNWTGQQPRVNDFELTIDLAGHTWNAAANQQYAFRCDYGIVTLKDSVGGAAMNYGKDYVFFISHLAGDYISKLVLADNITYTGKTTIAQAGLSGGSGNNKKYYGGELEILGGNFITVPDAGETYDDQGNYKYTLNLLDMNESAYPGGIYSPSKISVKGGSFTEFDPANCLAEGPNTNFVAEGYGSTKNGNIYTVVPANT